MVPYYSALSLGISLQSKSCWVDRKTLNIIWWQQFQAKFEIWKQTWEYSSMLFQKFAKHVRSLFYEQKTYQDDKHFKPNLKSANSHERKEVPSSFRSLQNMTKDHFSTRESCLIGTACQSHSCLQTAWTPSETGSTHRESKKDGKNNNKPCCSHVTQTHLSLWLTDRPCGLHHQSRTNH